MDAELMMLYRFILKEKFKVIRQFVFDLDGSDVIAVEVSFQKSNKCETVAFLTANRADLEYIYRSAHDKWMQIRWKNEKS